MKYIKWISLVVIIGLLVFVALSFLTFSVAAKNSESSTSTSAEKPLPDSAYATTTLTIMTETSSTTITAFIADTPALQGLGLSGRSKISNNQAMLFVFPEPDLYDFWMKEMKFPLDIIWLSSDKKVMYIEKDLSPDTYPDSFGPDDDSQYVIEMNAGSADRLGLATGDQISFSCGNSFCKR